MKKLLFVYLSAFMICSTAFGSQMDQSDELFPCAPLDVSGLPSSQAFPNSGLYPTDLPKAGADRTNPFGFAEKLEVYSPVDTSLFIPDFSPRHISSSSSMAASSTIEKDEESSPTVVPQGGKGKMAISKSYDDELDESSSSDFEDSDEEDPTVPAKTRQKPVASTKKKSATIRKEYERDHPKRNSFEPSAVKKPRIEVWTQKHRDTMRNLVEKSKDTKEAIRLFTNKFKDLTQTSRQISSLASTYLKNPQAPSNPVETLEDDEESSEARPKPRIVKRKKLESSEDEYEASSDEDDDEYESSSDEEIISANEATASHKISVSKAQEKGIAPSPAKKQKREKWSKEHRNAMYEIAETTKDMNDAAKLFTKKFKDPSLSIKRIKTLANYCIGRTKPNYLLISWTANEDKAIVRAYKDNSNITAKEILKAKLVGADKDLKRIESKLKLLRGDEDKPIEQSASSSSSSSSAEHPTFYHWTVVENQIISEELNKGKSAKEIFDSGKLPDRTKKQIRDKLYKKRHAIEPKAVALIEQPASPASSTSSTAQPPVITKRHWTDEERRIISEELTKEENVQEIFDSGKISDRTMEQIREKISRINNANSGNADVPIEQSALSSSSSSSVAEPPAKKQQQRWTRTEEEIIREEHNKGKTAKEVHNSGILPNRNLKQIINKLAYLNYRVKDE